ncbi:MULTISPECIES: hypothetical protein [unclassified Streptomyces]|uniref:hypothetical protein n=1 Tax=unclassified Streptomyces TaxID=2593676 RepID=UPI0035D99067
MRKSGRRAEPVTPLDTSSYQLQHELQQQFPPPQVVLAPGATWTNAPPVAVLPTWPEKLNIVSLTSNRGCEGQGPDRWPPGA